MRQTALRLGRRHAPDGQGHTSRTRVVQASIIYEEAGRGTPAPTSQAQAKPDSISRV
jgi:hypothetical protein